MPSIGLTRAQRTLKPAPESFVSKKSQGSGNRAPRKSKWSVQHPFQVKTPCGLRWDPCYPLMRFASAHGIFFKALHTNNAFICSICCQLPRGIGRFDMGGSSLSSVKETNWASSFWCDRLADESALHELSKQHPY